MSIEIVEKDLEPILLKAKRFSILVNNFVLGVGCDLIVTMFDEAGVAVKQECVPLLKEAYAEWGNDDAFIVRYICERFGFVIKPKPDPEPEPEPVPE